MVIAEQDKATPARESTAEVHCRRVIKVNWARHLKAFVYSLCIFALLAAATVSGIQYENNRQKRLYYDDFLIKYISDVELSLSILYKLHEQSYSDAIHAVEIVLFQHASTIPILAKSAGADMQSKEIQASLLSLAKYLEYRSVINYDERIPPPSGLEATERIVADNCNF